MPQPEYTHERLEALARDMKIISDDPDIVHRDKFMRSTLHIGAQFIADAAQKAKNPAQN